MSLARLFEDRRGRLCAGRILSTWLGLGLLVLLITILTPGCTHTRKVRALPEAYSGDRQLAGELHQRLVGSYFNPQTMTLEAVEAQPLLVDLRDRHFTTHTNRQSDQLDQAVRWIIRLIQQHIPPEEWGELDVGRFYDLPAR